MQKNTMNSIIINDEVNITQLFICIWKGKWFSVIGGVILALALGGYSYLQPDIYTAESLLVPNTELTGNSIKGLGGLGGLASLAGINMPAGDNKVQLALQISKTKQFTSNFLKKHDLEGKLSAVTSWKKESNTLIFDDKLFNANNNEWHINNEGVSLRPSNSELYKIFHKLLNINNDKETSVIRVSFTHISPTIAKYVVENYIKDINEIMRTRDEENALNSIEYLKREYSKTNIYSIKSVINDLIEDKTKALMFSSVHAEYVFKTLDPATIPEEKSGPNTILMFVIGFFTGFILVSICLIFKGVGLKNES